MSEQTLLLPPGEPPEPVAVEPKPPPRNLIPWLYGLGFLVLAAAIFYVWQYPAVPGETAANSAALQTAQQRLADIDARLTRLEQRPTPDIGKLAARVDALDARMADQTQLASRLDAVSGRIESLSGRDQTGMDATKQQIDALTSRVAALDTKAASTETVAKRLNRIARLQEASFALASGQPVGDVPNAPPALARYAHAAPPTQTQLRQDFATAEQAALAAGPAGDSNAPFAGRVWDRMQGLMTIRHGNDLVIGTSVATTLNQAQTALERGELSNAIAAVQTLTGQPAQAMADWLTEAKQLLDARTALDQIAGRD